MNTEQTKQQTAVEWLFEELNIWQTIADEDTNATLNTVRKLLEQAKQMEMQRIMQSYNDGKLAVINIDKNKSLEGYYNKTYASKGNELQQINQDNHMTRLTSSQTEISDEKIRHAAYRDESVNIGIEPESAFIDGAKWYREQLKKR